MQESKTAFSDSDPEAMRELLRGAEQFNSGRFFECHDTLEELWQGMRGPARNFLQGLIQISVGFYHLGNGNLLGGESQLDKGMKNLSEYGDCYLRLDLVSLRREVQIWLEKVRKEENLRCTVADLPKYRFLP